MLTSNSGIINQASNAKKQTEIAQEKEGIGLAITDAQIGNTGFQELNYTNLSTAINKQFGDEVIVTDNGNGSFLVSFNTSKREYEVNLNATINQLEKITDSTPGKLSGAGTESNPYLIESIEDLVFFGNEITSGNNNYENEYVKLKNSLNFNSNNSYASGKIDVSLIDGEGFQQIGTYNSNKVNTNSFSRNF